MGEVHKPNQQTVLFPEDALDFLCSLSSIKDIPGIGYKTAQKLETNLGINTIEQLQNQKSISPLIPLFGEKQSKRILEWAVGIDNSMIDTVKALQARSSTILYKTMSDEDSFIGCNSFPEALKKIKEILEKLYNRLLYRYEMDLQYPTTICLSLRQRPTNASPLSLQQK